METISTPAKSLANMTETAKKEGISEAVIAEAVELCRGAEALPEGVLGLARKLDKAYKAGRKLTRQSSA
jgi:hypothetical protein